MKEEGTRAAGEDIVLEEVSAEAFEVLLRYLYAQARQTSPASRAKEPLNALLETHEQHVLYSYKPLRPAAAA